MMAVPEPPPASLAEATRPSAVWIGASGGTELGLAYAWLAERMHVVAADSPAAAAAAVTAANGQATGPTIVVFATDRPGRWSLADAVTIVRRWPLALVVSVATSLVDGRRRSGPPLPGVEDVAWHDLPGRLERWLTDLAAGRPGPLGMPGTSRREERLLAASDSMQQESEAEGSTPLPVSIAAARAGDLEGLVDLLTLCGRKVLRQTLGRPRLDEPAPLLVWDVGGLGEEDLAWLRMLAANRPTLAIVLLDSFPRGDTTEAALRAGARVVLGRPVTLEALAGTLARLAEAIPTGLGPAAGHR